MTLVNAPTITDSVVQSFFIEALTGAENPVTYLDRFPDSIYNKSIDSLLVRFLYALLGPVGVGQLRREFLEARLQIEEAGLSTVDLDSAYTNVFSFARLADETYQLDADAVLLPVAQRAQILAQDASFRNRAIDFLKGARAGGTPLGLSLAASSGLARPAEAIEAYPALYDRYTDAPLGLPYEGFTNLTNEASVVPRQMTPQSAVQTIEITGEPTQGWFTLTYAAGPPWMTVIVSTTAGSSNIAVSNIANFPRGVFVTLTNLPSTATSAQINPQQTFWNHQTLYAQSAGGSGNTISLVYPSSAGPITGQPAPAPTTGNIIAFVGVGETTLLPFDASAGTIQDALMALPTIGIGNVVVNGGPLPDQPVEVLFVNDLADQTVPVLQSNLAPDKVVGITPTGSGGTEELSDNTHNPLFIEANVKMTTVGISADGQNTVIAPMDEHAMRDAVDRIRPQTEIITTQDGEGKAVRQSISSSFAGQSSVEVLRYVTGQAAIRWPPIDAMHWIEDAREHEAPRVLGNTSQQYQSFHNIAAITSYTEQALSDAAYGQSPVGLDVKYWDNLIGVPSEAQQRLVPALANLTIANNTQFLPANALAAQPEPFGLSVINGQGIINGIYPADYLTLQGVSQPTGGLLWASAERTEGVDYLELDLGQPQAFNYLYFEATRKPYQIDIAYDLLDQGPARTFYAATVDPAPSVTSLTYDVTMTNPWQTVTIYLTNALGQMIYTRYIRIGFTRSPVDTPFAIPTSGATVAQFAVIPYSIEVRNLRVGRSVVSN